VNIFGMHRGFLSLAMAALLWQSSQKTGTGEDCVLWPLDSTGRYTGESSKAQRGAQALGTRVRQL